MKNGEPSAPPPETAQECAVIAHQAFAGDDAPPFDSLPAEEQEAWCRVAWKLTQVATEVIMNDCAEATGISKATLAREFMKIRARQSEVARKTLININRRDILAEALAAPEAQN